MTKQYWAEHTIALLRKSDARYRGKDERTRRAAKAAKALLRSLCRFLAREELERKPGNQKPATV